MGKRNRLRGTDWAVIVGCTALALMTLGAIGESGRGRAKEAVCQVNLRQWHEIFQGYIEENDGKFLSGEPETLGYWWVANLRSEHTDWKRMKLWFCPRATQPIQGEDGRMALAPTTSLAWGVFQYEKLGPHGIAGSYGLNGYVIPIPEKLSPKTANTYMSGVPATDGWRDLRDVPNASSVPMFLDALRFDLWPRHVDAPAPSENTAWGGSNHMANCCINRHDGAVNCLFVDGSVRKVGLKELWTLKWHRSFNTAGPWTKAGGVLPTDWPEWLRPFKEY